MNNLEGLNINFRGKRYCELLGTMVKKFDLLNIVKEDQIKTLCGEFSFVNGALNKAYQIIFKRGLNMEEAISKISKITDKEKRPFINQYDATKIYKKFQELNNRMVGGAEAESKANSSTISPEDKKGIRSKLTYSERRVVDNTFDMMEVLLICLSLLPITGWAFDFPLLLYSLIQKKYTLAMITVLNWYIWAFLIIFGVNVNMGPTMKASYLGNHENIIKKLLLFPNKEPTKVLNPFVKARPKEIEGETYLVDDNGNVYSSKIKSPSTVGVITQDNKFVPRDSPDYETALKNNKKALHKDKVGPGGLM